MSDTQKLEMEIQELKNQVMAQEEHLTKIYHGTLGVSIFICLGIITFVIVSVYNYYFWGAMVTRFIR